MKNAPTFLTHKGRKLDPELCHQLAETLISIRLNHQKFLSSDKQTRTETIRTHLAERHILMRKSEDIEDALGINPLGYDMEALIDWHLAS